MDDKDDKRKNDASAHNESRKGVLAAYTNVRIPDEETFHKACEGVWAKVAAE